MNILKKWFDRIMDFTNRHLWLVIFLLLIPSFYTGKAEYFGPFYGYVFYLLVWPVAVFIVIDFVFIRKKKPSALMIVFLILHFWMTIEQLRIESYTYINYCNIVRAVSIVALIEMFYEDKPLDLIKALMLMFEILIYIDTVTIVINLINGDPKGETFLAWYNNIIVFTLPAICVAITYMKLTGRYIRAGVLCVVSVISTFISTAATPIMAMAAFVGLFLFQLFLYKVIGVKKFRLWPWIILALCLNVFLVVIYRPGVFTFIDEFVINVLHRSPNFTGRTLIWDDAIKTIMKAPIFGYGNVPESPLGVDLAPHPHNEILNTWMRYGIIGVLIYAVFSYLYMREIEKMDDNIYKIVFISLVFGVYIAFITDWISRSYIYYILFFIAYHFKQIKANKD